MRTLRVRLVGLGASLVLVLTGLGGAGTALANHRDNVAVACPSTAVGVNGGAAVSSGPAVAQGAQNNANAPFSTAASLSAACIAVAAGD
jgi:7-keto-8-aminopelargonate synthetase-like enzyme